MPQFNHFCFSRLARQASLPSVYPGDNGKSGRMDERKGIPTGSAPPPVSFNSFQVSQSKQGTGVPSGKCLVSIISNRYRDT